MRAPLRRRFRANPALRWLRWTSIAASTTIFGYLVLGHSLPAFFAPLRPLRLCVKIRGSAMHQVEARRLQTARCALARGSWRTDQTFGGALDESASSLFLGWNGNVHQAYTRNTQLR